MAVTVLEPGREGPQAAVLGALGVIATARGGLEARLIEAARVVVATTGAVLLADKGFTDVDELSKTRRRMWRAEAKRAACAEIEATLGMGVVETRHLVGIACAPATIRGPVLGALDAGEATWAMVRDFWARCARLPADQGALVAEALFGTEAATAARERLTPAGDLRGTPWHATDYKTALEREATRAEGTDAQAERERRRAAYQARRASLVVGQDGTATLSVTGPLIALAAAHSRIERAARLLRKHGDARTLDQLRADIATTLLIHGHLPLPHTGAAGGAGGTTGSDSGTVSDNAATTAGTARHDRTGATQPGNTGTGNTDPGDGETKDGGVWDAEAWFRDLQTPDLETIARVITAMPAIQLQVIIPWDTLTGTPACTHHGCSGVDGHGSHDSTGREPPGRGVGHLIGYPAYLTPGHARELALAPGTTLSRLLTDPADGRLIERTQSTYRPDAAMRTQIHAADLHSRAPGTAHPATSCELDHVTPWTGPPDPTGVSPGGTTTETNLVTLDKRHHQLKTLGIATATINHLRDLTWTTLLGHTTTTRTHDYRNYHTPPPPADPEQNDPDDQDTREDSAHQQPDPEHDEHDQRDPAEQRDPDDQRDLLNRALYTLLCERGPEALLTDHDDHPGTGDHGGPLSRWMFITKNERRADPHQSPRTPPRDQHPPPPDHEPPPF